MMTSVKWKKKIYRMRGKANTVVMSRGGMLGGERVRTPKRGKCK